MKAKRTNGNLWFYCPACEDAHRVTIEPAPNPWGWNGSTDKPTITPSVRVRYPREGLPDVICHFHVVDGEVRYAGDSTHALAGQNVLLPDWPHPNEYTEETP